LLYHLIGNCGCNRDDGFNVGATELIYLKDINKAMCLNSFNEWTPCCDGGIIDEEDKCDEYFMYDKKHNEMIGCVLDTIIIQHYDRLVCNTLNNKPKYESVGKCNNNSCPSCNDPTYYSINGSKCADNLDTCLKCKSASNIGWENASSTTRKLEIGGNEDYKYDGENPLRDCKDTSKFCKQTQDSCINNLHEKVNRDINNSGTSCSIKNIKTSIDNNKYIIQDCTYDGIKIDQDNEIIDVYLNEKDYCNPKNEEWECNRDDSIPSDCSKKNSTCTYDIHQQKCIKVCKPPYELLNNNECGTPDCGPGQGECAQGFKCYGTLMKDGWEVYACA